MTPVGMLLNVSSTRGSRWPCAAASRRRRCCGQACCRASRRRIARRAHCRTRRRSQCRRRWAAACRARAWRGRCSRCSRAWPAHAAACSPVGSRCAALGVGQPWPLTADGRRGTWWGRRSVCGPGVLNAWGGNRRGRRREQVRCQSQQRGGAPAEAEDRAALAAVGTAAGAGGD